MHSADNPDSEYLKTEKKSIINNKIIPRLPRISYVNNTKTSEEEFTNANEFKARAAFTVFSQIRDISFILLQKYTNNPNQEEAIQRMETLIKNRNTTKMTMETEEVIEREESVTPNTLIDRIDNHVEKTKFKIKKQKEEKEERIHFTFIIISICDKRYI